MVVIEIEYRLVINYFGLCPRAQIRKLDSGSFLCIFIFLIFFIRQCKCILALYIREYIMISEFWFLKSFRLLQFP